MFDHKHYIPILKTKAGERWAIENLRQRTKSNITPLFEIHQHRTMAPAEHAASLFEDMVVIWGTDRPFFLDTVWLHDAVGDPAIIRDVFAAARASGLQAIPVMRLTYENPTRTEIRSIVQTDGLSYLLRLPHDQVADAPAINTAVAEIAQPINTVHLMVDYRSNAMNLAVDVPRVVNLLQWQTFAAASGVFPGSLTHLPQGVWSPIQRNDWLGWIQPVAAGILPRRPTFSDYTMRDPGAPADFGEPSVNLRYTKSTYWLVRIGGRFKAGAAPQMFQVCQDLVARPDFDGANFSQGDQAIADVAAAISGPGNPQQWLQWCINHHIEFNVQTIRNHPAL
jgi:hypothetical protein